MVDVKNAAPDVENLENKSEERNATEHHVRQIVKESQEKQLQVRAALADFFFVTALQPFLKRRRRLLGPRF